MLLSEVILDWFCLINTKGVGPKTFWAMMRSYKSAKESLKYVENPYSKKQAEKILKSMNCEAILANDDMFPRFLRRSCFCPPILFFKGNKSILSKRKIAIIGARNASIGGRSIAKNLASNLSNEFAIVSGLARGIDTSSHIGSLENLNNKSAIAVLPFGFDNIYPKENQKLFQEIAENGLVLTEVSNGHASDQGMFQARNRIISLISEAVIVIEAAYKSGTIATAKLALDFGCEVMVVPGSPVDPRNLGSNSLIKNGATLIQNHFDVLEAMGENQQQNQLEISQIEQKASENTDTNDIRQKILALLSETPTSLEEISVHININIRELLCLVSELEISGEIIKYSNNEIVLSGKV